MPRRRFAFMVCLLHFTLHAFVIVYYICTYMYVSVCCVPTQISPSRNAASYMAARRASASALGREFRFIHKIFFFRFPAATRHTCPQQQQRQQAEYPDCSTSFFPFNFHFRFAPTSARTHLSTYFNLERGYLMCLPAMYIPIFHSYTRTLHSFFLRLRAEAFTSALLRSQSLLLPT